jgi:NitT/TauT family transport system substrate-binding protein
MGRETGLSARHLALGATALVLALAGCGGDDEGSSGADNGAAQGATKVTMQLSWTPQAQFAGYYAAAAQGFYEDEGLDVTIQPGGPDASVAQLVASGAANFASLPFGQTLQARDQGIELQNLAQVFTRSAYRLIAFDKSGIESIEDLSGKRVGVWPGTLQLVAAVEKYDVADVEQVEQPFTMDTFLEGELDAASATTYNEMAQVVKAGHPPETINTISFDELGTGVLEDGIISSPKYVDENQDVAEKFVRASLRGWIYCRDNADACVDIVLEQAPNLDPDLQTWMMHEVNKLIWPAPEGIGHMPTSGDLSFDSSAKVLHDYEVIEQPASQDAFRTDVWEAATQDIPEDDLKGEDFQPEELPSDFLTSGS